MLTVRLIGVIEAKQQEKDGEWNRNDRLLAVASHAHTHAHIEDMEDLPPHLLDEIEEFFADYTRQRGKKFKTLKGSARRRRGRSSTGMAMFLRSIKRSWKDEVKSMGAGRGMAKLTASD